MTRRFLRRICRALIGVVLLAQIAVSAYACPRLPSGVAMKMAMVLPTSTAGDSGQGLAAPAGVHGSPCAEMAGAMDPEFGNLCAEHCHHGQQSDRAASLAVPAVWLTARYITPLAAAPTVATRAAADATSALVAASAPLAILHCCFRI